MKKLRKNLQPFQRRPSRHKKNRRKKIEGELALEFGHAVFCTKRRISRAFAWYRSPGSTRPRFGEKFCFPRFDSNAGPFFLNKKFSFRDRNTAIGYSDRELPSAPGGKNRVFLAAPVAERQSSKVEISRVFRFLYSAKSSTHILAQCTLYRL